MGIVLCNSTGWPLVIESSSVLFGGSITNAALLGTSAETVWCVFGGRQGEVQV